MGKREISSDMRSVLPTTRICSFLVLMLVMPVLLSFFYTDFFAQSIEKSLHNRLMLSNSFPTIPLTHLALMMATLAFSLMMECSIDVVFSPSNADSKIVARFFIVLIFFVAEVGKYLCFLPGVSTVPMTIYFFCILAQFIGTYSILFLILHRLQPNRFSSCHCLCLLSALYVRFVVIILHEVYGDSPTIFRIAMICRTLIVVPTLHFLTSFLYHSYKEYPSSRLHLKNWFESLDADYQQALMIICSFLIVYVGLLLLVILYRDSIFGMRTVCIVNFQSMLFILFLVVIPRRAAMEENIRLKSTLEMRKTFVRYISHELRTPLNATVSGLQVLKSMLTAGEMPLQEKLLAVLGDTKKACGLGVEILNDLLTYEKLESNLMVLERDVQDPLVFLEDTLGPFRLVAEEKAVQLIVHNELEPNSCLVSIDEKKIAQVFRNLLSNAIKFTSEEGTVVVSIGQQGANLRVEVRDEGTGLSTENQAKLFSSVIQFHAKAQQGGGGSGMGLWISKKLTDMHGGEIGVFSEGEGRGSMFYFTVPVCDAEAALAYRERRAAESAIAEVAAAAEFRAAESLRVLICDDSVLNRKMLMRLFESHSHQVWEAGDGDVAVELVQQSIDAGEADRYKVITMDNTMVRMQGTEATKRIRAMGYKGYIFGVTGNLMKEEIQEFLDCGVDEVMPKPLDLEVLEKYVWDRSSPNSTGL